MHYAYACDIRSRVVFCDIIKATVYGTNRVYVLHEYGTNVEGCEKIGSKLNPRCTVSAGEVKKEIFNDGRSITVQK